MTDNYCVNCRFYKQYRVMAFIGPVMSRACWHADNTRMDDVEGTRTLHRHIEDFRKHYCKGELFEVKK